MAIALVNSAMGTSASDPATLSFTCNATSNLLVVLYLWRTTGTANTAATGHSYGAQTLNILTNSSARNGSMGAAVFYLFDPTTGAAQTISIDMDAAATAGRVVAAAFSGVDTTYVPSGGDDTSTRFGGTGTTASQSLSPLAADGVTVAGCSHEGANLMTAKGTNQVGLGGDADGFVDEGVWQTAFTYELNPPTGANADTQSFTNAASDVYQLGVAWFQASAGAPAEVIPYLVTARRR